ncbi:NAD(P)-dependent oxidoreductase [Neobacillus sp. SuZ13]|uniref:NAD-dependent epimerase/dehydratase family protein n=1 Tax=Neobacillus sp. SuZ13 TaxID=3047875 RepID=UPI0024C08D5F|nr:NAD(P)-dependent oxidoreductase [Neobacillus sp. SuZ13]WHY64962.1 NAD(P)-dependent oxidoreductase [Neobacillus sp. SuZ13]
MRAIISGSNGYFGSIACQYFQSKNWDIVTASRQTDAHLHLDLDRPGDFANLLINKQVDLFIHAAAAHEVACQSNPYQSIFQNVAGTKAALDFCVKNGIKNFVYLSTFHVFGTPEGTINEQSSPCPMNDYGLSHLQAEDYVRMYTRLNKINGLVIRPSNFFGIPADLAHCKRWTLVPLAFCKEAVTTGKIVLRSPGYQSRNFISVLDICKVIEHGYSKCHEVPLLHIPGPDTMSIRSFAKLIQRVTKKQLKKSVELVIPDGPSLHDEFTYSSLYLKDIYQPGDKIEPFVAEFCKVLTASNEE